MSKLRTSKAAGRLVLGTSLSLLLGLFIGLGSGNSSALASTGCDTSESTLVTAITSAQYVSTIQAAASNYRSCLSRLADSRNSYSGYYYAAGGAFYNIMTSSTTYTTYGLGRGVGLKAAADYRMDLMGEESVVNASNAGISKCDSIYRLVIASGLSIGDISYASYGQTAYSDCSSNRAYPMGKVTISKSQLAIGDAITGYPGTWPINSVQSYQWLRDGFVISGAVGTSYTATAADAGSRLSFRVTVSGNGTTNSVSRASATAQVALSPLTKSPTPTISGTFKVGQTLSAVAGTWDSGVLLAYSWLRNGGPIAGATTSTYLLSGSDAGKNLSVEITGTKAGFQTTVRTSAQVGVALMEMTLTPTPSINGTPQFARDLTASPGQWDSGVALAYQWLRNGSAISGATSISYSATGSDVGQTIALQITASQTGYAQVVKVSAGVKILPALFSPLPAPTISGAPQVEGTVTAVPGNWPNGSTFTYQWLSNGTAISGATSPSFLVTQTEMGKQLSVRVTASLSGYTSATSTSSSVTVPNIPAQTLKPIPTISGTSRVGNTLSVISGTWASGATLAYQWLRNGNSISGATQTTYTLTPEDASSSMSVRVTSTKVGYLTASQTSANLTIALGLLTSTPAPQTTGVYKFGNQLSAACGTWDSGTVLVYQWMKNGSPISAATASSYVLTSAEIGQRVSLRVTGAKPGYQQVSISSSETLVNPADFVLSPTPTIAGNGKVGTVLSGTVGTWDAGTSLSLQWLRNGVAITGATSASYSIVATDLNQQLALKVTANKTGFTTAARTSTPVMTIQGTLSQAPNPSISGSVRVGSTLTATLGVWDSGVSFSFRWLRGSTLLTVASTATSSNYVLTPADLDQVLTLEVTGSKVGFTPITRTFASAAVGLGVMAGNPNVSVSGTPPIYLVGTVLSGTRTNWDPNFSVSYSWLRDGVEITGATNSTYLVTSADAGTRLSFRATGRRVAYQDVILTTAAVAAKNSQTTTFSLPASIPGLATPYSLSATASSGLRVSYSTSTPAICTVNGQILSLVAVGKCTIVANQSGNNLYAPALAVAVSTNLVLSKTTTALAAANTSVRVGANAVYTARVTAGPGESVQGLTVRFFGRASQFTSIFFELGTATTDSLGYATLTKVFTSVQTPQIFASALATSRNSLSTASAVTMDVSLTPVTISLTPSVSAVRTGNLVSHVIQLSASEPANLAGQTIILKSRPDSFTSIFTTLASGTTDAYGRVVLNYTYTTVGSPQVFAELAQTSLLARATAGTNITVSLTPITLSLALASTSVAKGTLVAHTVQISSIEPANLAGITVTLKSRPSSFTSIYTVLATGVTDSNGRVVLNYTYPSAGSPQVVALITSTPLLSAASAAIGLTVTN